jgi:hypothetical protein
MSAKIIQGPWAQGTRGTARDQGSALSKLATSPIVKSHVCPHCLAPFARGRHLVFGCDPHHATGEAS